MYNENLKKILDKKEVPSPEDIIKLFFNDVKSFENNALEINNDVDFEDLGEPHDIETITGDEWTVSRLLWNTPEGIISSINLSRVNNNPNEIFDVDYEEVLKPKTVKDMLNNAIESENFEFAAEIRDWENGLKSLLLYLKPKIILAIENENINDLETYLTQIKNYKNLL